MLFLIYEQNRLCVLGKVPSTVSRGTSNYSHRGLRRKGFEKESSLPFFFFLWHHLEMVIYTFISFPSLTGTLQILPGPESRHFPFDFYSCEVLKTWKSFPNKLAWSLIFTYCLSTKELSIKTQMVLYVRLRIICGNSSVSCSVALASLVSCTI